MEDLRLKHYAPIVTGTPNVTLPLPRQQESGASFQAILREHLAQNSPVTFSKHAVKRAVDHNIELSADSLARLQEGVRLANERNLDDTLILVDETAFVVNAKSNTVITAVSNSELKGNVFTNINGTVII